MKTLYLLVILCLLPFVILSFFVHPSLDDLSIPISIRDFGTTRMELFTMLMQNWNGRFTSNILAVVSPLTFGSLTGYRLALALQLPALYFALYFFLKRLLQTAMFPKIQTHLLSAAMLLLYLNLLPDITETIYWLSGAKVYTWALIVQLVVAGLLLSMAEKESTGKTLLISGLIFILCGFNEIALVINAFIVIGYFIWPFFRKAFRATLSGNSPLARIPNCVDASSPSGHPVESKDLVFRADHKARLCASLSIHKILPMLSVVAAAIIVLTSPGNEGRLWHFPEGGHLGSTVRIAGISGAKLLGVMMQNMPLILVGFLLFPNLKASLLHPMLRPIACLHPAIVAAIALLFLFGAFAVPSWAMGINPPMRIYNFLVLYVMGFFLLFLFSLNSWMHDRKLQFYQPFGGAGKWVVVGLIFMAMAGDFHKEPGPEGPFTYRGNLARVTSDLVLRAGPFNRAMHERKAKVSQLKALGIQHVVVPPLINPPSSILFLDITYNPNHRINLLQAAFYGIEKIEVKNDR